MMYFISARTRCTAWMVTDEGGRGRVGDLRAVKGVALSLTEGVIKLVMT